jgi:hypothetical protein
MKKVIKNLLALSISTVVCLQLIPTINAQEIDLESQSSSYLVEDNIENRAVGFHTQEKVVKSERKNWVFCGYATNTWMKASSYQAGKTYSASTGYNFNGVSTTISLSKTISATIPANSNKWSRLAGYADITFKKVQIDHYQGGKKYKTTYRVDKIYHNKYLDLKYK